MCSLFFCWFEPVSRVPGSAGSSLWKGRSNRSISIMAYMASRLLASLISEFVCNSMACSSLLKINLISFLMATCMACFLSLSVSLQGLRASAGWYILLLADPSWGKGTQRGSSSRHGDAPLLFFSLFREKHWVMLVTAHSCAAHDIVFGRLQLLLHYCSNRQLSCAHGKGHPPQLCKPKVWPLAFPPQSLLTCNSNKSNTPYSFFSSFF